MCDFDGTIVGVDTGTLILSKFAVGDWRYYDKLYDRNGMPIEEVMRRQFSTVRATKGSMIGAIEGSARFRPGFEQLLRVCDEERVPFVVVSYGLDFCVRHVLDKVTPPRHFRIRAPKARMTQNGIRFAFPRLHSRDSVNLKDDLVRRYKQRGSKVVFVGDGTSDFPAIESADVRFAIRALASPSFAAEGESYVPR